MIKRISIIPINEKNKDEHYPSIISDLPGQVPKEK